MTETDYQKKGQVELKKSVLSVMLITEKQPLILDNADIIELYFREDIFKFCIAGTITFNDRYNIFQFGPFTGNEKIYLLYSVNLFFRLSARNSAPPYVKGTQLFTIAIFIRSDSLRRPR